MAKYQRLLKPRTSNVSQEATFLRRAFAFLFDILLIDLLITAPFTGVFSGLIARAESGDWMSLSYTQRELGAVMLLFAIIYFYFVLFEYLLGQTPGMMLANLRVDGQTGIFSLLIRNSFILPIFPFILFWIIEPIAIAVKRRGVLEHLSRTRTLYVKKITL